jgi:hypothetical protein
VNDYRVMFLGMLCVCFWNPPRAGTVVAGAYLPVENKNRCGNIATVFARNFTILI